MRAVLGDDYFETFCGDDIVHCRRQDNASGYDFVGTGLDIQPRVYF